MAPDKQFESAVERLVANLRAELTSALQRQAAQDAALAATERETAVRQAAEAVRKENQEQLEQVRRAAHDQVEAAKKSAQAESLARTRAEAQVEDVRRIGRAQVEEVERTMADRLSALTRELEESRRENAARRTELDSAKSASAAPLTDLARGIQTVDQAETLTAVFERLIEAAQAHAKSASVLMVRGDGLHPWSASASAPRKSLNDRSMSVATNAANERRRVESESAIAFPLTVGDDVVAVLYAEVGDALSPQRRMSKDALETLTRYAGRVLETITVLQAAGLRPLQPEPAGVHAGQAVGERVP